MESNELARVAYECKTSLGRTYKLTAILIDNWGFQYGNHHGIVIVEDDGYEYGMDARYDSRFNTINGFYDNILDVLKLHYEIVEYKRIEKQ